MLMASEPMVKPWCASACPATAAEAKAGLVGALAALGEAPPPRTRWRKSRAEAVEPSCCDLQVVGARRRRGRKDEEAVEEEEAGVEEEAEATATTSATSATASKTRRQPAWGTIFSMGGGGGCGCVFERWSSCGVK